MDGGLEQFYQGLSDELSLFVRHVAWLNAVPEKAEGDTSKEPEVPRRESLKKSGIEVPEMPPCDAPHLVAWLFEIGPTLPAGMSDGPITHGELANWQANTGITLHSWEARLLRRLSLDYLDQSHKARARDCPAPWGDAPVPNLKVERTRNALRALAAL